MRVIWLQSRLIGLNVSKHSFLLSTEMYWNHLHASSKPLPSVQAAFLSCLEPFTVMGPFALFFYLTDWIVAALTIFVGVYVFVIKEVDEYEPDSRTGPRTRAAGYCVINPSEHGGVSRCVYSAKVQLQHSDCMTCGTNTTCDSPEMMVHDGTQFFDHIELYNWTFQIHPNPRNFTEF